MKKLASLFLTGVMLAAMLTVFVVPASAKPLCLLGIFETNNVSNLSSDAIVNNDIDTDSMTINFGSVIIGKNATVSVSDSFYNDGTLIICGTLDLSNFQGDITGNGKIVFTNCCPGNVIGVDLSKLDVEYIDHVFIDGDPGHCIICKSLCNHTQGFTDGKCNYCNFPCEHSFNSNTGWCNVCGYRCTHTEGFTNERCNNCQYVCKHEKTVCDTCKKVFVSGGGKYTASTLSQGSIAIVAAISSAVVFGFGGFLLGRKKKPATSSSNEE